MSLLGMRLSALTLVGDTAAFIAAEGYIGKSETTGTSYGAGLSTAVLGLPATAVAQTFRYVVGQQTTLFQGRILLRIPWTLTTQAAGGNGTLSVVATITPPGGTPVVTAAKLGAPRNLNSANGTQFLELIALDVPSSVILTPGTTIDIAVQPWITTINASTYTPTLNHDPQTVASQLVMDIQGVPTLVGPGV